MYRIQNGENSEAKISDNNIQFLEYLNAISIFLNKALIYRQPVSSVGRVPDYRVGDRGFKPRPDQHSRSLNKWGESAAFVTTSANG